MCPGFEIIRAKDNSGREFGYETNKPLADLSNSLHLLERGEFKVDRVGTYNEVEILENIFGIYLPLSQFY